MQLFDSHFFIKIQDIIKNLPPSILILFIIFTFIAILLIISITTDCRRNKKNKKPAPQDTTPPKISPETRTIPPAVSQITADIFSQPTLFSVLFVSNSIDYMPVNTIVQTAINLAQEKLKVLIIDMDFERNAVQRVFESYSEKKLEVKSGIHKTFLPNINVWPAKYFRFANSFDTSQNSPLKKDYDIVLINCPDYQIIAANSPLRADLAYTFAPDSNAFTQIESQLKEKNFQKFVFCRATALTRSVIGA